MVGVTPCHGASRLATPAPIGGVGVAGAAPVLTSQYGTGPSSLLMVQPKTRA